MAMCAQWKIVEEISAEEPLTQTNNKILTILENVKNLLQKHEKMQFYLKSHLVEDIKNLDKDEVEMCHLFSNLKVADDAFITCEKLGDFLTECNLQTLIDVIFRTTFEIVSYNLLEKAGQGQELLLLKTVTKVEQYFVSFQKSVLVDTESLENLIRKFVKSLLDIITNINPSTYMTQNITFNLIVNLILVFKTQKFIQEAVLQDLIQYFIKTYSNRAFDKEDTKLKATEIESILLTLTVLRNLLEIKLQSNNFQHVEDLDKLNVVFHNTIKNVPKFVQFAINECVNLISALTTLIYVTCSD